MKYLLSSVEMYFLIDVKFKYHLRTIMKKVICEQLPSLSNDELEMVVGGRYDGCTSRPRKIKKARDNYKKYRKDNKSRTGGCNSRSR